MPGSALVWGDSNLRLFTGPPDPDFLHVNHKSRFCGEGAGREAHKFEIQILFWKM